MTGGDDERADVERFRLLSPTTAWGLLVKLKCSKSSGVPIDRRTFGDDFGNAPQLDRGARADAFIFVIDEGLAAAQLSSRIFGLNREAISY